MPQWLSLYSRVCAPQQEKPLHWEACASELGNSPYLPQLEKAHMQQHRPSVVKNKFIIKKETTHNPEFKNTERNDPSWMRTADRENASFIPFPHSTQ